MNPDSALHLKALKEGLQMNRFRLLSVLLFTSLIFANKTYGNEEENMNAYKETFKQGVLKDYTPVELSNNSDDLNSAGPFIILAGIDRKGHPLDIRPETEREKINFSLKNGKGNFALFDNLETKQNQTLSVMPDNEGMVEVLFYPDGSAPQKNCEVNVTVSGGPGITGSLSYKYQIAVLDSDKFKEACEKNISIQNKINSLPRTEKSTTSITKYDQTGTSVVGNTVKVTFFTNDSNGNTVLREDNKNGKIILKRQNNINGTIKDSICSFAKMWGETSTNYIYLNTNQSNGGGTDLLTFWFCDKNHFMVDKMITLSNLDLEVDNTNFDFTSSMPIAKSQQKVRMHLWGGKKEVRESTYSSEP
jgi:hypothetical protein